MIVDGKNKPANPFEENVILLNAVRCTGSCNEPIEIKETEPEFRFWSDANNWPNQTLPKQGNNVHIEPGWKMILDIEETPIYELIRVNGVLIFSDDMDIHLKAKHIFVRAGELLIGNETHPY